MSEQNKIIKFDDVLRRGELDAFNRGVVCEPVMIYVGRAGHGHALAGFCGFGSRGSLVADTIYDVVCKAKARWEALKTVEADLSEAAKGELAELRKVFG